MKIVIKPVGAIVLLLVLGWSFVTIVRLSRHDKMVSAQSQSSAGIAAAADTTPATSSTFTLVNGSFSEGSNLPDGWTNFPWMGEGTAHLVRDTTTFHTAPAALSLETATERTYTALDHLIGPYTGGTTFTIQGWVRVEGVPKEATVAIRGREVLGDIAPQKEWFHVMDARETSGWTHFEKQVTLQPGSKYVYLVLVLRGKGKLWIDDVSVSQ